MKMLPSDVASTSGLQITKADFLDSWGNVKRPMNAFMIFAQQKRCELHKHYPNAPNSDLSTMLGRSTNTPFTRSKIIWNAI